MVHTYEVDGWLAVDHYCRWELVPRSPVNFRSAGTEACWGQILTCELL